MTDALRYTACMVPLASMQTRVARIGMVQYGDKRHCPVCGREATQGYHADGMPRLQITCQVHPELNPMGYTLEELREQYEALDHWRFAERRRAPEAYEI